MTVGYDLQKMKIGDGYSIFGMHGTREAGALHFHEDGEILMHASDAGTPEVAIADTIHDLFTNLASGDLPDMDTFGGTDVAGTKLAVERTMYENEISQEISPIETMIVGEKAIIEATLKELSLTRLALLLGQLPSDVANVAAGPWVAGDVVSIDQLLVGGITTLPYFSWGLRIQQNRAALAGNTLYDWYYAPRCQVDPNNEITFVKNDIVKMTGKIHVYPSKQLHELTAGAYTFTTPSNTKVRYTMRSREGKGGLVHIFYERADAPA